MFHSVVVAPLLEKPAVKGLDFLNSVDQQNPPSKAAMSTGKFLKVLGAFVCSRLEF